MRTLRKASPVAVKVAHDLAGLGMIAFLVLVAALFFLHQRGSFNQPDVITHMLHIGAGFSSDPTTGVSAP